MDQDQKKIVVFSFYDPQEDWMEIKDSLKRKAKEDYYEKINSLIKQVTAEKSPMSLPKVKAEFKKVLEAFNGKKFPHLKDLLGNLKNLQKEWQPSVALARAMRSDNRTIDEYHLLYQPKRGELHSKQYVESLKGIIEAASPGTKVFLDGIDIGAGHNYQMIYTALLNYIADYRKTKGFNQSTTRYFVHVTAGSQAARMCLFLLVQERWIPAETIQLSKGKPQLDTMGDGTPSNTKSKDKPGYALTLTALVDSEEFLRSREEILRKHEDNKSVLKEYVKTQNRQYNKMIDELEKVVLHTTDPILILGPTGAGKSHLARQIHTLKELKGEFVSLNCATIPPNELGISELFGHVKGSFTGATTNRAGALKSADGGLLFLDEIGCLSPENQQRLLTFLDTGEFKPLGADGKKDANRKGKKEKALFQLICATNANLEEEVKNGTFRRDLLERIRTWQFTLPGLDDRKEDINPNIDPLLDDFVKERKERKELQEGIGNFPAINNITFDGQPRQKFLAYVKRINLPGNFRELRRMIWRMATFARNSQITMDVVENEIKRHQQERAALEEFVPQTHSTDLPPEVTAEDILQKLVPDKHKLDALKPIDRVRLGFVVDQCREARTAADVGRAIAGPNEKYGSNVFKNFTHEKAFKPLELSFDKIHDAWKTYGA